jgi:hypothetical protein
MMEYEAFEKEIVDMLQRELGEGYQVYIYPVSHNNGVESRQAVILEKGELVAECLPIEHYYELCRKPSDLEVAVRDILREYQKRNRESGHLCVDQLYHWECARDKVLFRLVNSDTNKKFLQSVPSVETCDLSQVVYMVLNAGNAYSRTLTVNKRLMDLWGVDTAELLQQARENTPMRLPARFMNAGLSVSGNILDVMDTAHTAGACMYVLTNTEKVYGAACIFYDGLLEDVAEKLGCGFYILPSSIHQVIIIPSCVCEPEYSMQLKRMVTAINLKEAPKQDILSDSIYYYNKEEKQFSIVL